MKIRLSTNKDSAEMARLRRTTIRYVNSKDYPKDVVHNWAAKVGAKNFRESADTSKRWVAVDNEKIIGFCEHTFVCEISRIYVHKDHLRKGVGSQLLKVAEDSLKKLGCQEITFESSITAKDFYEKNGYKVGKKVAYHGDNDAPVFKMSKKLY